MKEKVFVGMSGGVDSAVSAYLLKKQGYEVVGVFIRTWHPDFIECNEEQERHDAMRVAAYLDIPFLTFDLEEVYKHEVGEYMINEYRRGRTPNPDVMCNSAVKFGAFMQKSLSMGADFVATGHYAQIKNNNLYKAKDDKKDQSYFLWKLTTKELKKIIFPIGHLKKSEVRKIAEKAGLPVAKKKDSQGVCFLGQIDMKEFLKHYIKEKKGKVINEEGEVIGEHEGVTFFTLGERRGFTITKKTPNDKAYYIVDKNIKTNELIVSTEKKNLESKGALSLLIRDVNWISHTPVFGKKYKVQIRYHGEHISATLAQKDKGSIEIIFSQKVLASAGQSCVVSDGDLCMGGGIID